MTGNSSIPRRAALSALLLLGCGTLLWAVPPASRPVSRPAAPPPFWNQFRGPTGDGRAPANGLPATFGESAHVKWKTAIAGRGWSSPVVWGKQVWVTTATPDGRTMSAVCVDLDTGSVVHDVPVFENERPQYCHPLNSYATPTPVVEEGRVYVHFGSHGTACLDTATGKPLWARRDLPCNHYRGPASSPIVWGDLLIVHFDGFDFQYVVALNKLDGTTAWKHDRAFDFKTDNGDAKKAYCTPAVIEHAGRLQLIAPAAVATEALDPRTGELLWYVRHGGMNASARPLYDGTLVYLSNGMGQMVAVPPTGTGDVTNKVAWKSSKGVPKKSSPLLANGLLFMVTDQGVASCVDAKTGTVVWSERLPNTEDGKAEYAASPLLAGNKIYFFSTEGHVPVVEAGRAFKLLAGNKFDDGFMASPAVAGKALVLRTKSHLYRIEQ